MSKSIDKTLNRQKENAQIERQENLAQRYVELKERTEKITNKLGLEKFVEKTSDKNNIKEEAKKSFKQFSFVGDKEHELDQTAEIEVFRQNAQALNAFSRKILDNLSSNLTERKSVKIKPVIANANIYGHLNQGEQNVLLATIEIFLSNIDDAIFDITKYHTAKLHHAILDKDQGLIEESLKLGLADVNMLINNKNALEIATKTKSREIIITILNLCSTDTLNTRFSTGEFPIKYFIELPKQGNQEISQTAVALPENQELLQFAINKGVNLNTNLRRDYGIFSRLFIAYTALQHALANNNFEAAKLFIEKGAEIDLTAYEMFKGKLIGNVDPQATELQTIINSKANVNHLRGDANLKLQYGFMLSDFLIKPSITCANEKLKHNSQIMVHKGRGSAVYKNATYPECYLDKLDTKHALNLLPSALSLALKDYISPFYTTGAMVTYNIAKSEQPVTDALYAGIGFLGYAAISYALGPINIHPFVIGIAIPITGPLIELSVNLIGEGCHQLMGGGD